MDPRQAPPHTDHRQAQNPRFSWQLPLDELPQRPLQIDTSSNATQQYRQPSNPAAQHGAYNENRYSYMETPVEHQHPTFANTAPHRPSQPNMSPIPQSPDTPIDNSVAQSQSLLPLSSPPHTARTHSPPQNQLHMQPQYQEYPPEKQGQPVSPQQVHPAHYVPYTDSVLQTSTFSQPTSPQPVILQPQSNPPQSPGPLPVKSERNFQEQPNAVSLKLSIMPPIKDPNYVPHSNARVQSPKQPLFSPDSLTHPTSSHHQPPLQFHNPGQISHPNMNHTSPGSSQEWKHSLCGGDGATCLEGIFCPCIIHGKTTYRLSQKGAKKDPTDLLGWSRFNGSCIAMALTCGLCGLLPLISRYRIRHAYHLEGSLPGDIIKSCCCCCCVVIQNESEIKAREENSRRWAGPGTGEAYSPGEQMVYAPPPR